jgi:hypothetical protein
LYPSLKIQHALIGEPNGDTFDEPHSVSIVARGRDAAGDRELVDGESEVGGWDRSRSCHRWGPSRRHRGAWASARSRPDDPIQRPRQLLGAEIRPLAGDWWLGDVDVAGDLAGGVAQGKPLGEGLYEIRVR